MSASRPQHDSNDELLSAYVDNELTAAERTAVEARLRTDEQARQFVAELRAASQAMQALPRAGSPRDFAASVLGQIERERLAIEPSPVVTLPPIDDLTEHKRRRGLIYAAAALAAAVMLMLLRPADQPPAPDQLAQGGPRRRVDAGAVRSTIEAAPGAEEKDAAGARPMATAPAPPQEAESSLAGDRAGSAAPLEQVRTQSDLTTTIASAPAPAPAGPPAPADNTPPAPAAAPMSADAPAPGEASGFGGLADASRFGGARREAAAEALEVFTVDAKGDATAAEFEQLLATHGIAIVDEPSPGDASKEYFDALSSTEEQSETLQKSSAPARAYLIEASPEQVAALTAALRTHEGKLTLTADELGSPGADARGFRATSEGRGGFGGGRGGSDGRGDVAATGRAWRLSAAPANELAARDSEARADADASDEAAAVTRSSAAQLATASPRRALFVLQPDAGAETAMPAAPAAGAAEPQP